MGNHMSRHKLIAFGAALIVAFTICSVAEAQQAFMAWNGLSKELRDCVGVAARRSNTTLEGIIAAGVLPSDPRLSNTVRVCKQFVEGLKTGYPCKLKTTDGRETSTTCNQYFGLRTDTGFRKVTKEEAFAVAFTPRADQIVLIDEEISGDKRSTNERTTQGPREPAAPPNAGSAPVRVPVNTSVQGEVDFTDCAFQIYYGGPNKTSEKAKTGSVRHRCDIVKDEASITIYNDTQTATRGTPFVTLSLRGPVRGTVHGKVWYNDRNEMQNRTDKDLGILEGYRKTDGQQCWENEEATICIKEHMKTAAVVPATNICGASQRAPFYSTIDKQKLVKKIDKCFLAINGRIVLDGDCTVYDAPGMKAFGSPEDPSGAMEHLVEFKFSDSTFNANICARYNGGKSNSVMIEDFGPASTSRGDVGQFSQSWRNYPGGGNCWTTPGPRIMACVLSPVTF
jgi:hypothetical protein